MLKSTLRKLSSLVFCLLFANSVWADNVLLVGINDGNIRSTLENAGHTVSYSSSTPADLSNYQQVWDMRYNQYVMSASEKSSYDSFLQNSGYLYFAGENSYFATRNNDISAFVTSLGGGSITVGGSASNAQTGSGTFFPNGETVDFIAAAAITLSGSGRPLACDSYNRCSAVMWIGNAGDFAQGYNGTVVVIADINWTQGGFFDANNQAFLEALVDGVVYSTVQGTISESGTGAVATPMYSSGITAAQSTRRTANLPVTGMEANISIQGNSNLVTVEQIGDAHYLELGIVGGSNTVAIEQTTVTGGQHYLETTVQGSNNNLDILQSGTAKTAFVSVDGDGNTANIIQKDSGQHYLQLDMIGDSHDATVVQEGSGNHAATVELTNGGGAWNFNLNQAGSTPKEYSLPHSMSDSSTTTGTCAIMAGCSLTVIQND